MLIAVLLLSMAQVGTGQMIAAGEGSLFADIKAHSAGDIVTVLIVESARASRESSVEGSSSSGMSAEGSVSGDLGSLTKLLPSFGASSGVSNSHQGSEGTEQRELFRGKLSAMIVEVTPNGMLVIEGERLVEVNGKKNTMHLKGLVRPRDVGSDNIVYSYNIANASITYDRGGLNKIVTPGTLQKVLTWILGIGLVGLAVVGT